MNREDEDAIQRSLEEFEQLSGQGHSQGWKFNREEIHERSELETNNLLPETTSRR
jgi:hypothetical protein